MTALIPSYAASGEKALSVVIERFLRKHQDAAEEYRSYFAEKQDVLTKLSWAVAKRVEANGQPMADVPAQAVDALRGALIRRSPDQAESFGEWFAENASTLTALAKGINKELVAHKAAPADLQPLPEEDDPDLWSPKERTEANVRAIDILRSGQPIGEPERRSLLLYSGMGGLSLNAVEDRIPPEWLPDRQGLVHEYYTPTRITREVARVVRPMLAALKAQDPSAPLQALEPSAGVGRFVRALSGSGFEGVRWTAVEFSHVSARILAAARPDITVYEGPFEQWVADNEEAVAGQLSLVVSNPPYGKRGGTITLDPDPAYRERQAYPYFLRRGSDLLRPGGISVFLIPYGFLSSKTPTFFELRRKVLLRHHLIAAFRLPSSIFPGANLVTDLIFQQARGGELAEVLPEDQTILEGRYFELEAPHHILGTVIGEQEPDDPDLIKKKARFGYEIAGEFTELPAFNPRPLCTSCWSQPFLRPRKPKVQLLRRLELAPHLQAAVTLGERVAEFLKHFGAASDSASAKTAAALYGELRDALAAWQKGREAEGSPSPYHDRELQRAAKDFPELTTFLSAFEESGQLAKAFQQVPRYEPKYRGSPQDVIGQAQFLRETRRRFSTQMLIALRAEISAPALDAPTLEAALYAGGFCQDDGHWLPEGDYYTGDLWPKYERAKERAAQGDPNAERQKARLAGLLAPPSIAEISPEPRLPWIPVSALQIWVSAWTQSAVPALSRESGLLVFANQPYSALEQADARLKVTLGYLNHDLSLFMLDYEKQWVEELEREETAAEALDRVRLEYAQRAVDHFTSWLKRSPESARAIEQEYGARFRGYVLPVYEPRELEIARWRGSIHPRPHQRAGAWRLLANGGGLLSFDVGVGKTLTGIAVAAYLRQEGRARRILCVLPNTIMLKWEKDFLRALPDYRIVLIGVEKYVGRSGIVRSRTDTAEERALKYRQFQAGEYDIAFVTYSMFGRTGLRAETLRRFVAASPPVQRELGLRVKSTLVDFELQAEKDDKAAERKKSRKKKKASLAAVRRVLGVEAVEAATPFELERMRVEVAERLAKESASHYEALKELLDRQTDLSERNKAVFSLEVDRWVAETLEAQDQDPGIYWEDLKVDLLILDEAQNYKNLWAVAEREGGLPKYLGAISEGSQRAWNFALRSFEVRERNGGSGVVLLSATPAKNSPLEYYSLLGYVDTDAWTRLGILNPEIFIDRYLRLERRWLIEPDLSKKERSVVAGFKNLNELRDIIFRYGEFRTAEEVGLKLPDSQVETRAVPMSPEQKASYGLLVLDYANALKRAAEDPKARLKGLGTLQRMALVSIHPELDTPPTEQGHAGVSLKDLPPIESDDSFETEGFLETEGSLEAVAPEPGKKLDAPRRGHWTWRNAKLAKDSRSPKIEEAARIGVSAKSCAVIYFCENVAVHFWLKQELVRQGVPAERIAVLNAETAPTAQHRQTIAEKFNGIPAVLDAAGRLEQEGTPPEFDHVIANAVAYEGIDLQVRTCQVVHLDLPWEPATLQQRNGRAVRQGNLQAVIRILYLVSAGSVDVIRLQMITGKLGWMRDILQGADRETNNPAAQSELSIEEMLLYLAGGDAEQAIAELRRQQEEERRKNVLKNAWTTLAALISRVASLARVTHV
jgi:N12 class adenine-specific DNA methylase